jgi:hypothetical protein
MGASDWVYLRCDLAGRYEAILAIFPAWFFALAWELTYAELKAL